MNNNSIDNILRVFVKPDIWLACIELGNDRVFGKIKGNLALLESIPEPSTGFRFKDVVEVSDPVGTTIFRDEQISIYKAQRVIRPSKFPTFSFEAIVSSSNDWFDLSEVFKRQNTFMRFPYQRKYPVNHWKKGYCVAANIEEVESIFEEFIISGKDRKVKNILDAFNVSNVITSEIDGRKFVLELKYAKKFTNSILIVLSLPVILFLILAITVGLNSAFELLGFIITILFFCGLGIYLFIRLNRETITLTKDGLLANYLNVKQKEISWKNISEVKLSKSIGCIVVRNNTGQKIRINRNLKHFRRFCIIANNLIRPEVSKKAFEEVLTKGIA
jgi:hypothetical protein